MGKRPYFIVLIVCILVACTSDPNVAVRPRLVQEVTLQSTAVMPTRVLSPTPSPIVIPVATTERQVATIAVGNPDFILITPTLPPSKTPTLTPSITPTFPPTLPPTITRPVINTGGQLLPTQSYELVISSPQACQVVWFFSQPNVPLCPLSNALTSPGAFQQFQQGFMIWVGQQDAIYTVYNSGASPRWQVFRDTYEDGDPENDPQLTPPPDVWQPRRGFGEVWRDQPGVRDRIGWAVMVDEVPFTTQVQIAANGTIFIAEPRGGIIALEPGGQNWNQYAGS